MALGYEFAPLKTVVAASQTDAEIAGGASIFISGIWLHNTSGGGVVTLEDSTDGAVIMAITLTAGQFIELSVKWLADKGLQVTTPAATSVVVFHSQPGA